jgi:hypothetical protein
VHEPSLEEKVQLLWDHRQIEDCLNRYSRGFDRGDMEIAKSAYWPDALDDHPGFCGLAHAMCDHFDTYHKDVWESTQHHITNTQIEIDGDTAHAESYVLGVLTRKGDGEVSDIAGGRYLDRLERRDGEWRIAARKVIVEWCCVVDGAGALFGPANGFPPPRWDREDLSYERPLTARR